MKFLSFEGAESMDYSPEEKEDPDAIQDAEVNKYLREPIQVCESTPNQVPQQLQILYNACRPQTECDALIVVLNLLMMETGFTPKVTAVMCFMFIIIGLGKIFYFIIYHIILCT